MYTLGYPEDAICIFNESQLNFLFLVVVVVVVVVVVAAGIKNEI